MIDLHCHILPAVDDGPADLETAIEMGRIAATDGVEAIVATPHIRADYPFELAEIPERVAALNRALLEAGVNIAVLNGGEVAISIVDQLDDDALRSVCLGNGSYLLVESPYTEATELLEQALFALQVRGFRIVLAHPERSPSFQQDPDRLARLVEQGMLCSLTAMSITGRFGATVQRFTRRLLRDGLAHNVASDAHDTVRRRPTLAAGIESAVGSQEAAWLTNAAPLAILSGAELPSRGVAPRRRGLRRWRR